MKRNLLIALRMTVLTLLVLGIAYPLAITGVAQIAFRDRANGSLVASGGRIVGSQLVGQGFASERYFHSRPSAAGQAGYDASASSASNLGPTSRALIDDVADRVERVLANEPGARRGAVPVDLVTASAAGWIPHISPDAAMLQVARVARVRGLEEEAVRALVEEHVEHAAVRVSRRTAGERARAESGARRAIHSIAGLDEEGRHGRRIRGLGTHAGSAQDLPRLRRRRGQDLHHARGGASAGITRRRRRHRLRRAAPAPRDDRAHRGTSSGRDQEDRVSRQGVRRARHRCGHRAASGVGARR